MKSAWVRIVLTLLLLFSFFVVFPNSDDGYISPKLLCLVFCLGLMTLLGMVRLRKNTIWIWMIVPISALSLLWVQNPYDAFMALLSVCTMVLPVVVQLKDETEWFRWAILGAMLVNLLAMVFQWTNGTNYAALGVMGNSWASSHLALLTFWFLPKQIARQFWFVLGISLLIGLLGPKSCWIGLGLFWIPKLFSKVRFQDLEPAKSMLAIVVLCILLVALAGTMRLFTSPGMLKVLTSPTNYLEQLDKQPYLHTKRAPDFKGKTYSMATRQVLWANTLTMIGQKPFLGYGIGQFATHYPRFSQSKFCDPNMNGDYRPISTHNFILQSAVQFGLLSVVPVCLFLFWMGTQFREWEHRAAWSFFWVVALWQPIWLVLPGLFFFLGAPSENAIHPSRPGIGLFLTWMLAVILGFALFLRFPMGASFDISSPTEPSNILKNLNPEYHVRQGEHFYREDDSANAHTSFGKALRLDPYNPNTLYNFLITNPECQEGLTAMKKAFPYFRPFCQEGQMKSETNPAREQDLGPRLNEIARHCEAKDLIGP